eukprot:TRINITY_DN10601_c0_g1_i1.p1 TRINITY_DN10601_c0_g1~~TRINITY_DN10601_c0_g1_i1.p1  ORF type:complete len:354 (+),score=40.62 TRINITY_DN10601_c0_g1_i1:302-1363(+)
MDDIKTGECRELFHGEQLIGLNEDEASTFARGYRTSPLADACLEQLRKITEATSCFEGFAIFHSVGGGTGSGLASVLLDRISSAYPDKIKLSLPVYPSPRTASSLVEPYNALLASHHLLEHTDLALPFETDALHDIVWRHLNVEMPTNDDVGRVFTRTVSNLTSSVRFGGGLNRSLAELQGGLVQFPRIHFLLASCPPVAALQCSTAEITKSAFESRNLAVKSYPGYGRYSACCVMYRGDVATADAGAALDSVVGKHVQFVEWEPRDIKYGVNPCGAVESSRCASMIGNNTCIAELFGRVHHKSSLMYSKRAFVHWYIREGMEEGEFTEAFENLADLEKDYEEMGACYHEDDY